VAYLRHACGDDPSCWPRLDWLAEHPVGPVLEMLRQRINSPLTSSCGRLFDAVAALTGRWAESGYEAQAAMEFMALADSAQLAKADVWPEAMSADDPDREPLVIPVGGLVRAAAEAVVAGVSPAVISARFHRTLAGMLVAAVIRISRATGLQDVVLAGGVFQNELLLMEVEEALSAASLQPLRPQLLPPGDGALAVGQAVVAARSVG
jgi:hydrogenase maturation protein HypF